MVQKKEILTASRKHKNKALGCNINISEQPKPKTYNLLKRKNNTLRKVCG